MQYFLPSARGSLRSWSKNEQGIPAALVGVSVSRLHALIVVARLKRKGIAERHISALAAPGQIPDGLAPAMPAVSVSADGDSALRSVVGESVEVAGPLQERLLMNAGRTLEEGLRQAGLSGSQVSSALGAIDAGRVVLWIEAQERGDLTVVLDLFEANGVTEVYALAGVASRAPFPRASLFDTSAILSSAILA